MTIAQPNLEPRFHLLNKLHQILASFGVVAAMVVAGVVVVVDVVNAVAIVVVFVVVAVCFYRSKIIHSCAKLKYQIPY